MKKQILLVLMISGSSFLTGCQSTQSNEPSSLATDAFQKSKCLNCTLDPFYVDGHWIKGRD